MDAPLNTPRRHAGCMDITPATMARDALSAMTEPQRLAFVGAIIAEASSPMSVLQLRVLSKSAQAAADDLERSRFVAEQLRQVEGRV